MTPQKIKFTTSQDIYASRSNFDFRDICFNPLFRDDIQKLISYSDSSYPKTSSRHFVGGTGLLGSMCRVTTRQRVCLLEYLIRLSLACIRQTINPNHFFNRTFPVTFKGRKRIRQRGCFFKLASKKEVAVYNYPIPAKNVVKNLHRRLQSRNFKHQFRASVFNVP